MPVRHGLTLGELAEFASEENKLAADLHIVKMKNWQRGDWFDSTGLTWIDPSPNMRSLNAAALYDGLALLEASPNYSVGRGTDAPFEQIGADWIHGAELADFLNRWVLPRVRVYATKFQPSSGPFTGKAIEGVRFVIVNREQLNSVRLGLDVAYALQRLYPGKINFEACRFLFQRAGTDGCPQGGDGAGCYRGAAEGTSAEIRRSASAVSALLMLRCCAEWHKAPIASNFFGESVTSTRRIAFYR
jgi:uncharacterized protein YbbC (DUF1343 family)